jgi:hypothetical protein
MSYSDFDLRNALFAAVPDAQPGESLQQTLRDWAPAALAMNTEKARSEMIIAPILMEVVQQSGRSLNLFSGIDFDVDRDQGLNGACDFLLTRSHERFYLRQPVIAVVEAKREDIVAGLGQCVAALVAAQIFNARSEEGPNGPVHGAVTTGNIWRFLRLEGSSVLIDRPEYHMHQLAKILGILLSVAA